MSLGTRRVSKLPHGSQDSGCRCSKKPRWRTPYVVSPLSGLRRGGIGAARYSISPQDHAAFAARHKVILNWARRYHLEAEWVLNGAVESLRFSP